MYADRSQTMDAVTDLGASDYQQPVEIRTQAGLRPVQEKIDAWMRFFGYPHRDIFAVRLAVREAVTNAIRHGHGGDAAKPVLLTYRVLPDETVVRVEDQGPGFEPTHVPNPMGSGRLEPHKGFGLFLMRVYTSWMHFNERGNVVTLGRCRSRT
jgi:serine/threonine-protein kinase RsbW